MGPRRKDSDLSPTPKIPETTLSLAERIKAANSCPLEPKERGARRPKKPVDRSKLVRNFIRLYCREVAIRPLMLDSLREALCTTKRIQNVYVRNKQTDESKKQNSIAKRTVNDSPVKGNNSTKKSTRRLPNLINDGKTLADRVNKGAVDVPLSNDQVNKDLCTTKISETSDNLNTEANKQILPEGTNIVNVQNQNNTNTKLGQSKQINTNTDMNRKSNQESGVSETSQSVKVQDSPTTSDRISDNDLKQLQINKQNSTFSRSAPALTLQTSEHSTTSSLVTEVMNSKDTDENDNTYLATKPNTSSKDLDNSSSATDGSSENKSVNNALDNNSDKQNRTIVCKSNSEIPNDAEAVSLAGLKTGKSDNIYKDSYSVKSEFDQFCHIDTQTILKDDSVQCVERLVHPEDLSQGHNEVFQNQNVSDLLEQIDHVIPPDQSHNSLLDDSFKKMTLTHDRDTSTLEQKPIEMTKRPPIPRYKPTQAPVQAPVQTPIITNECHQRHSSSSSSSATILPLSETDELTTSYSTEEILSSPQTSPELQKRPNNPNADVIFPKVQTKLSHIWNKHKLRPSSLSSIHIDDKNGGNRHPLTETYFSDTQSSRKNETEARKMGTGRNRISEMIGGQARNKQIQNELQKFGPSSGRPKQNGPVSNIPVPGNPQTALNSSFLDRNSDNAIKSSPFLEYPHKLDWFVKSGTLDYDEEFTFETKKQTKSKAYQRIQRLHYNRNANTVKPSSEKPTIKRDFTRSIRDQVPVSLGEIRKPHVPVVLGEIRKPHVPVNLGEVKKPIIVNSPSSHRIRIRNGMISKPEPKRKPFLTVV